MIAKKAHKANNFKRELISYPRARDAWQAVLQAYHKQYPKAKVILPAYIGWTVTEGSGIFDPVTNVGIDYEFYGLNKMLRIDFEDMKRVISANPGAMVLMVHYFGFPDDRYSEIVLWLKKEGVFFIEDLAHAMLTDLIGGACGRAGNYSFYSLHKNLPFPDGGMLAMNNEGPFVIEEKNYLDNATVFDYDLQGIFQARRNNYLLLLKELNHTDGITILYPKLDDNICPQSFPILLNDADRNSVFKLMNEKGFGLVSLYYTMIEPLRITNYESAAYTSKHITNLPVHQDCDPDEIKLMADHLKALLS